MPNSDFSIALRNYAGVPVVELVGDINKRTLSKLDDILDRLVQAGHYDVMINLKRAAWENLSVLASLEKVAKLFQTHYGNLNVVAEVTQINGLLQSKPLSQLLRFCTSEGQALTRIRKLPGPAASDVVPTQARLRES